MKLLMSIKPPNYLQSRYPPSSGSPLHPSLPSSQWFQAAESAFTTKALLLVLTYNILVKTILLNMLTLPRVSMQGRAMRPALSTILQMSLFVTTLPDSTWMAVVRWWLDRRER